MVLKQLNHPNVIRYYQTDLSPTLDGVDVIIEFMPGGSLKTILQKYQRLDERIIKKYAL